MSFKLVGIIQTTPRRIFIQKQECHGITSVKKTFFKIKISEKACKEPIVLVETVLHELCHLWLYAVSGLARRPFSDPVQERIINKTTKIALSILIKELHNYE